MGIKQLIQALAITATLLLAQPIHAETYYFHNDHLGTPQALTDDSGTVVWQGSYSPFGEATETTTEVEQNIRFPGQYFEEETGLHYNYFRDYDPRTGRYIESDPIGLWGGLGLFSYVGGGPINASDFLGLVSGCFFQAIGKATLGEATGGTKRVATKEWSELFCGPKGSPSRPGLGSGMPSISDLVGVSLLCQRTYYEAGVVQYEYERIQWGVLRCYGECGGLIDETYGFKSIDPTWVDGDKYMDSYDGAIFEVTGGDYGPGDLPPLRR